MPLLLEVPGVSGKSPFQGHETWLPLDGISWNAKRNLAYGTSGSYGGAGIATAPLFSEIVLTRKSDSTTALLWNKCVRNETFTGKLHWLRVTAGGKPDVYCEMTLTAARIIKIAEASSEDRPVETLTLSFGEFEVVYTGYGNELSGVQASTSFTLARD